MRLNSITTKLLLLVSVAAAISNIVVLMVADRQTTSIINQSQNRMYADKVANIEAALSRTEARLQKTGLVAAYQTSFQDAALKDLRAEYYQEDNPGIYPFILDSQGSVVLHPIMATGDSSTQKYDWLMAMIGNPKGHYEANYQGRHKWYVYKHFTSWDWYICYAVPLDLKYQDSRALHVMLIKIMGAISLTALLILALVLRRLTRPISELTANAKTIADGDLAQEILAGSKDEIGNLAQAFNSMRLSLAQKISEMARLTTIIEATSDLVGQIRAEDGRVTFLNKAGLQMLGWQEVDYLKKRGADSHPSWAQKIINEEAIPHAAIHGTWLGETAVIGPDGQEIPTSMVIMAHPDDDGQIIYYSTIIRDISEQKNTAQELLKIKKLESVGILAGGIAHDFNNILAAILGNIELASMSIETTSKAQDLLDEAKKASIRAKDLTQQLLTFAKGGAPVKQTSFIDKIIVESANFVLHGSSVICEYNFADDLWQADVDTGQISQVIQNIIINARHAMPEGGVIKVSCENSGVETGVMATDRTIKITIIDSGAGISAKHIDKIFDPYFSTKQTGSGLGLAICHSIITKHEGTITVESEVGKGTTFTISLPASLQAAETRSTATKGTDITQEKYLIMVMDDDPMIRTLVQMMLSQLGHEVIAAADGNEAINLYQEHLSNDRQIDVTIMDLTIPGGMGGQEAVQEILKINPAARVVVSSGYSNDPVMASYKDYGFAGSIAKPFQMDELIDVIRTVSG